MFDLTKMSPDEAKNAIALLNQAYNANIALQQQGTTQEVNEILLDLSVERPRHNALEISFPFISMHVDQASDANTQVNALLNTRDDFQKSITLTINDTVTIERGVRKVYLYWKAQASKSMLIKFFTTAKMESGTLVLAQTSNPSLVTVGGYQAPLDGFLDVVVLDPGILPAVGNSSNIASPAFVNSLQNNGGTYGIVGLLGGQYLVPNGYTAEILSSEINVTTAITSTSWTIDFLDLDTAKLYGTQANLLASARGVCYLGSSNLGVTTAPKTLDVFVGSVGCVNSGNKNRYFTSGRTIGCVLSNYAGAAAGAFQVKILIRLTKNVGA